MFVHTFFRLSLILGILGLFWPRLLHAQIDSIAIELTPPNLLITGSFVDLQWKVKQSNNPQAFDLTFFREGPCGTNQSLISGVPPADTSSGPHVVALCDGDRVSNKIFVIGRESTNGILVPGSPTLEIISDTVPPDPPNLDIESNDFPKTVYTPTFQITGNVDNSLPAGNATDKPETAGSVTVFTRGLPDPVTGEITRNVLGGGLIQPNSRYIATIDISSLPPNVPTSLIMIATDTLGNESAEKPIGDVSRGIGGDVNIQKAALNPSPDSITRHSGVLISGQVFGTVAPFAVKFYMDGFLNSEIAGLSNGDNFSHSLNMTSEGQHCFEIEPENSNTPIFKPGRTSLGCITLDQTPPPAPQLFEPNPNNILITKGPTITIRGTTEADVFKNNALKPKVFISGPPGITYSPISPIEITTSGNFTVSADIQDLPDGQHTITVKATDEVGNTDPTANVTFTFIKDTVASAVEEVRVDNVLVPQINPPLFVPSKSILLSLRLNEAVVEAPRLEVGPFSGSQFTAGLRGGSGRNWEYSFSTSQGQDGPINIVVSEGPDTAGNKITFGLQDILIVDTLPPIVASMIPNERSILSKTPNPIRIVFEDRPLIENLLSSGVDTQSASIELYDPENQKIAIDLVEFDPITVDVIPRSQFTLEGDYKIEIIISDKAGNRSLKDTRLFTMDFTGITDDQISCFPENNGFARFGVEPFTGSEGHSVSLSVNNSQFDAERSTLLLKNFQEIPQTLPGVKKVTDSKTIRYELNTALPNNTSKDGKYVIEAQIFDTPGNLNPDFFCVFTYDNCRPSVESFFPSTRAVVSRNLRHVSAVVKDCLPRFDVEVSDIDLSLSSIRVFKASEDGANQDEIRSRLRFETLPGQRSHKLLLEFIDQNGVTTSLPNDGSADGRYNMEIEAFDRSGNRSGTTSSFFTLDTIDPILIAENLENDQILAGGKYFLFGKARDNSGGSGLDRVEIQVQAVNGLIPTTTLVEFTPVLLTGAPLPPTDPDPAFRDWSYELNLNLKSDTNTNVTLRAYDKAGNYRDYSFRVIMLAGNLNIPEKSVPVNNFSTDLFFVNFGWAPVLEASSYELEIITPNQNKKKFIINGVNTRINIASLGEGEGTYGWNIRAMDSHGNRGPVTLNTNFQVDQTQPKITSIQVQDPSPESQGRITQGVTRFIISFNESMNINKIPKIELREIGGGNNKAIPVQVLSFFENTLTAQVKLDAPIPGQSSLQGFVRIFVDNGEDLASNSLAPIDPGISLFEIYTGPLFEVKFFSNPVDNNDLIFVIKGLIDSGGRATEIPEIPSVIIKDSRDREVSLDPLRLTKESFAVTFNLNLVSNNNFTLIVTGRDKYGNTNSRSFYITIAQIFPSNQRQIFTSLLKIEIPSNGVSTKQDVVVLPAETLSIPTYPEELELIQTLDSSPHLVPLLKDSTVTGKVNAELQSALKNRDHALGLYLFNGSQWIHMSKAQLEKQNFKATSQYLGPMALMLDNQPPKVEGDPDQTGQQLQFKVFEKGSGINLDQSAFIFRGKRNSISHIKDDLVQVRLREVGHEIGIAEGQLELVDNAGNKSISKSFHVALQGTPQVQLYVYPNPARQVLNYEIRTNFIPLDAEMYVYDTAGDRVYRESLSMNTMREKYQWSLLNSVGDRVNSGVYFLKVRIKEGTRVIKKTMKVVILN